MYDVDYKQEENGDIFDGNLSRPQNEGKKIKVLQFFYHLTTKDMHVIWKVTGHSELDDEEWSNSASAQLCMAACPKCKQTGLKGQHSCLRGGK